MFKTIQRAIAARNHVQRMRRLHQTDIDSCIKSTARYSRPLQTCITPLPAMQTDIAVLPVDTVSAIFEHRHEHDGICVLNFANPTVAGGMFLDGSNGQEESLCHASVLYNVLDEFKDWFEENRDQCNDYLYEDRALYTPLVRFERDDCVAYADVITCAAPNAYKWNKTKSSRKNPDAIRHALRHRIDFILQIAAQNRPDVLILGAFGCGHFGNDPQTVADIFAKLLREKYTEIFKKVVFAIPRGSKSDHFKIFEDALTTR